MRNRFVLGSLCKRNHGSVDDPEKSLRYISNGVCVECNNSRKEYHDQYRQENIDKTRERCLIWRNNNKEQEKKRVSDWQKANRDKKNKSRNIWRNNRKKKDESFRISENIRTKISHILKKSSKSSKTLKKYNVDVEDIISNVGERPSDNYELDHIIPVSYFDHSNDFEVFVSWNPKNLRWIPIPENRSKSDILPLDWPLDLPKLEREYSGGISVRSK